MVLLSLCVCVCSGRLLLLVFAVYRELGIVARDTVAREVDYSPHYPAGMESFWMRVYPYLKNSCTFILKL